MLQPSCEENTTAPRTKHHDGPKHGYGRELAELHYLTSVRGFFRCDSRFELMPEVLSGVARTGSAHGLLAGGVTTLSTQGSAFNAPISTFPRWVKSLRSCRWFRSTKVKLKLGRIRHGFDICRSIGKTQKLEIPHPVVHGL